MKVTPHRKHPLWLAFFLHRVSGLGLALFLPVHFWVLSLSLNSAAALDGFIQWTNMPAVKIVEFGLVFFLAVHMFGGLRLMALEWLPWSNGQKTLAAAAVAASILVSGTFFLNAV